MVKQVDGLFTCSWKYSLYDMIRGCYVSLPFYMQIHWTASFPLSPLLPQGLLYFIQFDLAPTIQSCNLMSCTISIWHGDTISSIFLYDTHLCATHMTTSSIRGVQIHIYLVSSTTDPLCQSAVVFNLYQ